MLSTLEIYFKIHNYICVGSISEFYGKRLLIDRLICQWVLVGWIFFSFLLPIVVYILCLYTFNRLDSRRLHDNFLLLSCSVFKIFVY